MGNCSCYDRLFIDQDIKSLLNYAQTYLGMHLYCIHLWMYVYTYVWTHIHTHIYKRLGRNIIKCQQWFLLFYILILLLNSL